MSRCVEGRPTAEQVLLGAISAGAGIRQVEAKIYTVLPDDSAANAYDSGFGSIYETVACNPVYNRLVWGYSIRDYGRFAQEALSCAPPGPLLDLACGSLSFTAGTYLQNGQRTVVLTDQSMKMLRFAKRRLVKLHGEVPANMIFLCADALDLPFRQESFSTILSLNLLHCLPDLGTLLAGIRRIASDSAGMYFTTLVVGNRLGDGYLNALARAGKLVSRDVSQLDGAFQEAGIPVQSEIRGNLAFIRG